MSPLKNGIFNIGPYTLVIEGTFLAPEDTPASFRPFLAENGVRERAAKLFVVHSGKVPLSEGNPISTTFNDLGKASLYASNDGWLVKLTPKVGEPPRVMLIDHSFGSARIYMDKDDRYFGFILDSMSRIFFSQYAAACGSLMLHASVVVSGGLSYIFMGKSGTGKSTHSRLWIETFPGTELLNDDCPLVSPDKEGRFYAYGTPWSGKTPCWKNQSAPVGGIARLRQAPYNRFIRTAGIESFISFIPGMSVMTSSRSLYDTASDTALRLLDSVPTGILECLPDTGAVTLCRTSLLETNR